MALLASPPRRVSGTNTPKPVAKQNTTGSIYLPGMMNTGVTIPRTNIAPGSPTTIHPPGPKPVKTPPGSRGGHALALAKKASNKNRNPPGKPDYTPVSTPSSSDLSVSDTNTTTDPNSVGTVGYGKIGNGTQQALNFDPQKYAAGMAGMKYDPAIQQLTGRIQGIVNALPGSLDALHQAFANIDNMVANPVTQPVVGGSTTAAGDQFQAQNATITNDANAAQARSAAAQEASAIARLKLINNAQQFDLGNQLTGLNLAKGDAQAGYLQQGIKTKSDLLAQAIRNVNSERASDAAAALAAGEVKHQELVNKGLGADITGKNLANKYTPVAEALALKGTAQSQALSAVALKTALHNLKNLTGPKTLTNAISNGGADSVGALESMIIPPNAIVADPNNKNKSIIYGNPNTWLKNGVAALQKRLPDANKANLITFARGRIANAVSAAQTWDLDPKTGQFVKRKK